LVLFEVLQAFEVSRLLPPLLVWLDLGGLVMSSHCSLADCRRCAISFSVCILLPEKNESGVALRIPITRGEDRSKSCCFTVIENDM